MADDRRGGGGRRVGGRYLLLDRIGAGGAGTVWRGEDERLGRRVAIKEIIWTPSEPDASRRRSAREARAAARLDHPSVVRIYDVVEGDDRTWLVMELVDAPSLTDLVRAEGPLTPGHAARLGLALADALDAAHAAGVVHRDVKPSNVLVAGDRPLLTDFGISRAVDDQTLTAAGTVLGTPAYLAPEQAQGERIGPAADLYSLGATLYFAVEGVPPFRRATAMATASAVISEPPRPAVRAAALGPLLDDLLAKDPAARPGGAELRARLEEAAARWRDQPVVDLRASRQRRSDARGTRDDASGGGPRRGGAVALLAAGLLLLVGVVGVLALGGDVAPDADPSEPPAAVASAGTVLGEPDPSDDAPEDAADGVLPSLDTPVPDDWIRLDPDDAPYAVSHPPGWQVVERTERRTDVVDPETGAFLRLEWTDVDRDPVEAWQLLSADFAERNPSYEELSIESTTFRQEDAALWEYRYTTEEGAMRRALNLGISRGAEYGLAVNLQVPEASFDDVAAIWPAVLSSLELQSLAG